MSSVLEYNGYLGSAEFSAEDEVFHGRLEGIRDLVTYEGTDVESLKRAFHKAVDDYIATCERKKGSGQTLQGNVQRATAS
jgi:predicted HicB family RNase H-like nuclease